MRRSIFIAILVLGFTVPVSAQTIVLSDTAAPKFTASTAHNQTWGTPPIQVLSGYEGDVYLATQVSGGVPSGSPQLTIPFGKPTPDGSNQVTAPPLKPSIPPALYNTELRLFIRSVGPGGSSPTALELPSPFGRAAPPAPPGSSPAPVLTP
jgi:hypothetical protein